MIEYNKPNEPIIIFMQSHPAKNCSEQTYKHKTNKNITNEHKTNKQSNLHKTNKLTNKWGKTSAACMVALLQIDKYTFEILKILNLFNQDFKMA